MKERSQNLSEKDKKIVLSKTLTRGGSIITTVGSVTVAQGLITQHGEYGSLGALICGIGISAILTGIRQNK